MAIIKTQDFLQTRKLPLLPSTTVDQKGTSNLPSKVSEIVFVLGWRVRSSLVGGEKTFFNGFDFKNLKHALYNFPQQHSIGCNNF
jgi:hypothetical protein